MTKIIYDQNYIKQCFDAWYLNGRPSTNRAIKALLPIHPSGRQPHPNHINKWIQEGAWHMWADEMDARAYQLADDDLVNRKASILKEHSAKAVQVRDKALDYLLDKGFDSASSAVQAFFKAQEEQRKTEGFSDLLEKLDKMTNNDVEREIIGLLNRASENDQVIDADTVSNDVDDEDKV